MELPSAIRVLVLKRKVMNVLIVRKGGKAKTRIDRKEGKESKKHTICKQINETTRIRASFSSLFSGLSQIYVDRA